MEGTRRVKGSGYRLPDPVRAEFFLALFDTIERFDLPRKLPNIVIVGDDMHEAKGPDAFHRKSLVRFIKRARGAVIVSSAPVTAAYAAAASNAALFRQDIVIIETRLEFEPAWKTFIENHHPGIALLLCTVKSQGGVQ